MFVTGDMRQRRSDTRSGHTEEKEIGGRRRRVFCTELQEMLQSKTLRVMRQAIRGGDVTWKRDNADSQERKSGPDNIKIGRRGDRSMLGEPKSQQAPDGKQTKNWGDESSM